MITKHVMLAGLLLLSSGSAWTQEFNYHPSLRPVLGKGMSIDQVDTSKEQCLKLETSGLGAGAQRTTFQMKLVSSEEALLAHLGIDVKAEASFLGLGGGSTSTNLKIDTEMSQHDITLVIEGETLFGSDSVLRGTLREPYQAYIEQGQMKAFAERCGTHFVESVDFGVRLAVLIRFTDLSHSEKLDLQHRMEGKASIDVISAGASSAVDLMLQRRGKNISYNMQVVAMGSEGIVDLAPLIRQMGVLNRPTTAEFQEALATVLGKFDRAHAAILSFRTAPMERYGYQADLQDQVLDEKFAVLGGLAKQIRTLSRGIDALNGELTRYKNGEGSVLGIELLDAAERTLPVARKHRSALVDLHRGCFADKTPEIPSCRLPVPQERSSMTEFWMLVNLLKSW